MHEVHRGAPQLGFFVKFSALLHKVAHVGDVHADFVDFVSDFVDGKGVVQVLGGQGIDCEYALLP